MYWNKKRSFMFALAGKYRTEEFKYKRGDRLLKFPINMSLVVKIVFNSAHFYRQSVSILLYCRLPGFVWLSYIGCKAVITYITYISKNGFIACLADRKEKVSVTNTIITHKGMNGMKVKKCLQVKSYSLHQYVKITESHCTWNRNGWRIFEFSFDIFRKKIKGLECNEERKHPVNREIGFSLSF